MKKENSYVLLNKPKAEAEFKYTFFDNLLTAAEAMYIAATKPSLDKNLYIFKYSDYLIFKRHREERTPENLKECHKIKPIEVGDLADILNGHKVDML